MLKRAYRFREEHCYLDAILLILSSWAELESGSANVKQKSESIHLSKYKNTTLLHCYTITITFPYMQQAMHFSLEDLFPIIGRQN